MVQCRTQWFRYREQSGVPQMEGGSRHVWVGSRKANCRQGPSLRGACVCSVAPRVTWSYCQRLAYRLDSVGRSTVLARYNRPIASDSNDMSQPPHGCPAPRAEKPIAACRPMVMQPCIGHDSMQGMQGMQRPDLVPKTTMFGKQGENAGGEMMKASYK